ncbi:MAG: hypothetical protein ABL982_08020, partial [Vicinamibacterales bacterium]
MHLDRIGPKVRILLLGVALASAAPLVSAQSLVGPGHEALLALDRYLETWNSRNPALWATSLHYPHVRPGAGPFEVSQTAAEYAAGVVAAKTFRAQLVAVLAALLRHDAEAGA